MFANSFGVTAVMRLAVMVWAEGDNITYAVDTALGQRNYVMSFQERAAVGKLKSRCTAELALTFCAL